MRVRLAFAVAAHLDTEILLADEVLAVGDAAFQKKCIETMGSLAQHGRTVLFVSHNMGAVGDLCPKSILLEKGKVIGVGQTREIILKYLAEFSPKAAVTAIEPPAHDKGVAITRIGITDCSGKPTAELDWEFPFSISVEFRVTQRMPALSVGIALVNQLGIRVLFSWVAFQSPFGPGIYQAQGQFPGEVLTPGRYSIDVGAEEFAIENYHLLQQAASFEICQSSGANGYNLGEYAVLYSRIPWQVRLVGNGNPEQPL
jgi:lipopolysaccharide transport system ATP-binding protein